MELSCYNHTVLEGQLVLSGEGHRQKKAVSTADFKHASQRNSIFEVWTMGLRSASFCHCGIVAWDHAVAGIGSVAFLFIHEGLWREA